MYLLGPRSEESFGGPPASYILENEQSFRSDCLFVYVPSGLGIARVAGPLSIPTAVYTAHLPRVSMPTATPWYTPTLPLPYPTATEHLAPLHLVNAASTQEAETVVVSTAVRSTLACAVVSTVVGTLGSKWYYDMYYGGKYRSKYGVHTVVSMEVVRTVVGSEP